MPAAEREMTARRGLQALLGMLAVVLFAGPGSSKELPYISPTVVAPSQTLVGQSFPPSPRLRRDLAEARRAEEGSSAPATAQPAAVTARTYACGAERIAVVTEGETVRLTAAGSTLVLRQVRVASGARYEAEGDASTWFWSHGQEASLRIRGRGYPECVASGVDPAAADAGAFRAIGHEPGWRLDIANGQLTLETAYGQNKVSVPAPFAEAFAGGRRYIASSAGRPITATILDRPCADAATGMPRPFTVRVEFAGQTLQGCGGETAALLRGEPWVVQEIAGAPLVRGSRASLIFDDQGRVTGTASCNNFTAPYTLTGEGVTIGAAAATRKACAPAVMKQEAAFLAALAAVQRIEVTADGTLVLHTASGQRITSRRE
jgi:heat shock protein HslJ/membrane-bound inhibitor of C-type lysozyme